MRRPRSTMPVTLPSPVRIRGDLAVEMDGDAEFVHQPLQAEAMLYIPPSTYQRS